MACCRVGVVAGVLTGAAGEGSMWTIIPVWEGKGRGSVKSGLKVGGTGLGAGSRSEVKMGDSSCERGWFGVGKR